MRKISKYGLSCIKQWEGLRLEAYRDVAGVLTIGYGHTGKDVKIGQQISRNQAENLLLKDLARFEEAVSKYVKVDLTDNQFACLVSFAFNIGVTAFKGSKLLKKLNKGNYDAVPQELMRWTYSGGKISQGLVNRRSAEVGLWAKGSRVSSQCVDCDRDEQEQISKTKEGKAVAVTSIGALGATFTEIAREIQPQSENFTILRYLFAILTLLGIGLTLFAVIKRMRG
ncbi:lysozyme [Bartonella sp. DGB1]|uniref:lysozyme n=1 Tax=Bartonella sp. DGB1 TaxID=3239807 RepID=UPI0035254AC7